jgi:hypothetical protein
MTKVEMFKYRGDFNWYGKTFTMYRYATSFSTAFNRFIVAIAEEVDRSIPSVRLYFSQQKDNYHVELVVE